MHTAPEPLIRDYPRTDPRLGRKLHLDARSLPYIRTAADPRTLRSVSWPRPLPILNQDDLGACVGFTAAGALGSLPLAAFPMIAGGLGATVDQAEDYARGIYSEATAVDPWEGAWPPEDTGTDGLSAAKILKRRGLIGSYLHATDLAQLITLLQDGPVMMGLPWYEAFFEPEPDGRIDPRGWADTRVAGGHEVLILGVELAANGILEHAIFIVANSWGKGWGLSGFFKMGAYTYSLLRADIDLIQLRS